LKQPKRMGLLVELCARAAHTPLNYMESPPAISHHNAYSVQGQLSAAEMSIAETTESFRPTDRRGPPAGMGLDRVSSSDEGGTRRGFWNRNNNNKKQTQMQAAEAAAAVARMLIDENGAETSEVGQYQSTLPMKKTQTPKSDYEVTLRSTASNEQVRTGLTEDLRLGSVVIPLTKLELDKTINENKTVRLEQWHQFETGEESSLQKKPSVLLEISIYSPEVLDESEDELDERSIDDDEKKESFSFPKSSALVDASFSRRMSIEARGQTEEQETTQKETKTEDPALEQGIVDFLAVVGCKDIGNQKKDDGMKGWVKTTPESIILEQFPPDNDFHIKSGRRALLPEMVQWFCFPEGTRLWRGTAPPSHSDLNLKRFSASSPPNVASSIAAFDACLNCTTSFSWFVIASNSDEYGSSLVKTYGAVIRFYVPAPTGIDPTQDDFAQTLMGIKPNSQSPASVKRLWVPIGICLTSNLPIIGVMEALLLRLCEELSTISGGVQPTNIEEIQKAVANITLNYQKPVAGAVNCSIPFLAGDRFLLSLPPRTCLPPLPHGRALVSVCRLLGAEGLNYLLAAVLTECKILFHSEDIADIAMVAEVITALIYPFSWSLPYIPILPLGMIEIVEAPISYMLGIPSCNLKFIEHGALDDTVVVDLNKGFSSADYSQEKMKSKAVGSMKHPPPLPGSLATNVSNAVYKLLRAEEEIEEEYRGYDMLEHNFPRLESESLAEREFRVTIAIEICGLLRGYQDCVGTVFNRDKFLKIAPALYEEKRVIGTGPNVYASGKKKVVSTRTKRFLSMLINGQNFQQLLESLESDEATFFHEIMQTFDESASDPKSLKRTASNESGSSSQAEKGVILLMKSLQKIEDKIPTFCVENEGGLNSGEDEDEILLSTLYDENEFYDFDVLYHDTDIMRLDDRNISKFTTSVLSTIDMEATVSSSDPNKRVVSMEYLEKLETTPWQYNPLFKISVQGIKVNDKVKLRDAIGDRRFRAWKLAQDKKSNHDDDLSFLSDSTKEVAKDGSAMDLTTLITSAKNDLTDSSSLSSVTSQSRVSSLTPTQERIAAAKGRDIIRRCLDIANTDHMFQSDQASPFVEDNGRDLMAEAEKALRNPSAQLFLLSILAQRSRLESKRTRTMRRQTTVSNSASRLNGVAFDCLVRLSCAMLDSCMEYREFELAYRLLTNSSGFIMVLETGDYEEDEDERMYDGQSRIVITMTSRIGLHPIFADLGVWEAVMALHLRDRIAVKKSDEFRLNDTDSVGEDEEEVEYESAVATLYEMVGYGIPGEELSRFAMRASQEHGWFCDDRGRQLLMLARRISIRRDQSDMVGTGDIDMVRKGPDVRQASIEISEEGPTRDKSTFIWKEFDWCHPSAPSSQSIIKFNEGNPDLNTVPSSDDYMKRSAVTALASFGTSMVASGGLDGGVFLAHSIQDTRLAEDFSSEGKALPEVRGIHLDWGSASRAGTGSSSDGEYGVGAVSCLAAAYGDTSHTPNPSSRKDTEDADGELDMLDSLEGSRVIAGTTAGDLRVWSVKDIYSSILMTKNDEDSKNGHAAARLKYSLRGRALSGHRGGVTCIDVPSQVYRPDSLVTGGADGSIKLWSLRAPTGSRRTNSSNSSYVDGGYSAGQQHQQQRGRGSDALSTLSGHTGRILCIKTAWHGDHLLSGGADRAIRVWDLSGNKCIHRLCGHFGWITNVQYWGPNTIVSASTDRSVALWDARVRSSPLFMLRHHRSPISDLLVGSRTDPYMVSAAADGTIATWDFRSLSNTIDIDQSNKKDSGSKGCKIVRQPSASIRNNHANNMQNLTAAGPVHLARSVTDPINSFLSIGSDSIIRKWDVATGNLIDESPTGHCEIISSFESFSQNRIFASNNPSSNRVYNNSVDNEEHSPYDKIDKGFLTSSLDGTIRMRKLVGKSDD
jgi:WD40 repeat protein